MANSVALLEHEAENPVTRWTSSVICTKRQEGSYSLQLCVSGELGSWRDRSITRIRSPEKFVESLFHVSEWSELRLDRHEIAGDICGRLSELDSEFASAVADYIRSGDMKDT